MRKRDPNPPWINTWYGINTRCTNKNATGYKYYGGSGIKNLLTKPQIKKLWYRDRAYRLKQPCMDRINPKGNYELNNCRYIERIENSKRVKRKLTLEIVNKMREEWGSCTLSQTELCVKYGVTYPTVNGIINRRLWKY